MALTHILDGKPNEFLHYSYTIQVSWMWVSLVNKLSQFVSQSVMIQSLDNI